MSTRAIRLLHAHTHAGQRYAPGALLFVDTADAAWLVGQGIGESTGPAQLLASDHTDDAPLALSASTDTETDSTGDDHE